MDEPTTTTDVPNRTTLPEPPGYENPYEPGDAGYESAQTSGYYGIMYAGDYEWDAVRCTAEAYGEYDRDAHPAQRRITRDGQPRRSLKFHTGWLDVSTAAECIREIDSYNRFTADAIVDTLESLTAPVRVVVGRESSPALYLWAADPLEAYDAFDTMSVEQDAKGRYSLSDERYVGPDELGIQPDAESYPTRFLGETADTFDGDGPALLRAWWD